MTAFYGRTVAFLASIKGTRFRALMASSGISTALIIVTATAGGHSNEFTDALRALAGSAAPVAAPVASTDSTPIQSPGAGGVKAATPLASPAAAPASTGGDGGGDTTTPTTTQPKLGRVKHVWVVSLASPGYDASFGAATKMPYLSGTLRPQGELLENYALLSSAALPNYIAMTSGQPPNAATRSECSTYTEFPPGQKPATNGVLAGDACVYPSTTPSITDQVGSLGLVWHGYMEDMAKACQRPALGAPDDTAAATSGYVTRHNPFAYYNSGIEVGDCTTNDLPLTQLAPDLAKAATSTPNFSFISPNLCHDGLEGPPCASGDPGGPASTDAFLQTLIPQIQASAAYKADGLIVVTFGETFPKDPSDTARVGTLLLSKFLTPGATRSEAFNPYTLLRSLQDVFGAKHYAMANSTAVSFGPEVLGPKTKAKKKKSKKKKK